MKKLTREDVEVLISNRKSGEVLDLTNCDFTDVNFTVLDLDGANFSGSILKNAYFTSRRITFIKLKDANFKDCFMPNSTFTGTDLTNANFENCIMYNTNFVRSNLTDANFTNADVGCCDFNKAIMDGMDLSAENFQQAYFSSSDKKGTK